MHQIINGSLFSAGLFDGSIGHNADAGFDAALTTLEGLGAAQEAWMQLTYPGVRVDRTSWFLHLPDGDFLSNVSNRFSFWSRWERRGFNNALTNNRPQNGWPQALASRPSPRQHFVYFGALDPGLGGMPGFDHNLVFPDLLTWMPPNGVLCVDASANIDATSLDGLRFQRLRELLPCPVLRESFSESSSSRLFKEGEREDGWVSTYSQWDAFFRTDVSPWRRPTGQTRIPHLVFLHFNANVATILLDLGPRMAAIDAWLAAKGVTVDTITHTFGFYTAQIPEG